MQQGQLWRATGVELGQRKGWVSSQYCSQQTCVTAVVGLFSKQHLPSRVQALSNEANEMLPVFNKTSSKHYSSAIGAKDWISPPPPQPSPTPSHGLRHISNLPLNMATKQSLVARKFSQDHKNKCEEAAPATGRAAVWL